MTSLKPSLRSALLASVALALGGIATQAQEIDLTELTVDEIQTAFAAGDYTAEELTQAYLERIETYEPVYNAFVSMNENALEDARAIDERRAAGEELGPLAGIPIAIKEAMDVAGLPSTTGWPAMSSAAGGIDFIPQTDAPLVARLREAGAIIIGKTNIPQFSAAYNANNSWAGPTYSAFGPDASPGGSSAGSATAVSGNFVVLATAEDTSGSIQAPAGVQGIVGVKPTFGLVPNAGIAPLGGSLRDVGGPFARTVKDAAVMLDVIAGYSPADPKTVASIGHTPEGGYTSMLSETALEGARIGLYGPGFEDTPLSEETEALYQQAIAELEAQGATVIEDPFAGTDFAALAKDRSGLGIESMAYDMGLWLQRMGPDVPAHTLAELTEVLGANPFGEDSVASRFVPPETLKDPTSPPDLTEFVEVREQYLSLWEEVMEAHDLDALVFPHDHNGTPTRLEGGHSVVAVPEINIGGTPGVVVPAGQYENGMPFSLIFLGPQWSEGQLLAYAYDYEQATHHRIVPELADTPFDDVAMAAAE